LTARSGREKKRLQRRNATTYNTNVCLNSRPDPDLKPFPGGIVRLEKDVVHPVSTEAACDDNDTTEAEKDHETDALVEWQRKAEQSWNGESVDHEVSNDIEGALDHERGALGDAISVVRKQSPVAADGTTRISVEVGKAEEDTNTYMHCTHSATKKTTKARKTRPKVAQTNFRNSDFSGAIRKYDTKIDILTKLDASTKSV
jgi:hypothetical protein